MSDSEARVPSPAAASRTPVIIALIWLVGFCAVFFQLDLPNQNGVNRLHIWAELPFLLLNMVVQHPDFPDSSWAFLPQRFPFILAASVAWFGAWGLGQLVLRLLRVPLQNPSLERFVLGCGVGLSGLSLIVLGLGLLAQVVPGALSRPLLVALCLLFGIVELALFLRERQPTPQVDGKAEKKKQSKKDSDEKGVLAGGQISFGQLSRIAAGIAIALFVIALSLGAMLPPLDFDVREYHLGGPKEYFQNGYVSFLPHNVYTSFPFLTEMLSLLGMILCDDWYEGAHAGKLIISAFAPLTTLAVFAAARRWFGELAAWSAALIHISTPWTYRISIIAYAEGGLTFYLFASLLTLHLTLDAFRAPPGSEPIQAGIERHPGSPCPCMVGLTGMLAGSSMACKYPGVLQVVIPVGVALLWLVFEATRNASGWRRTVVTTALLYSAGVLIAVGPWLLKNLCETGNPVYPLVQSVFHGVDWTPTLEANWKGAHSPAHYDPVDFFIKLFDVTLKSDWLSPLLFSLAPFALLGSRSKHLAKGLWLYVAFLFLSWWVFTHRLDRFWIPMIPVVSVLAGAGVAWSRDVLWQRGSLAVLSVCCLFNLGFISTTACGLNEWLRDLNDTRNEATLKSFATMNRMLDSSKVKILMVGEAQIFDARFPLIYNTVFDISLFEQWCSAAEPDTPAAKQPLKPTAEIRQKLLDENITHIFVNWQEVLRYRMTYGYTEFVAPHRFVTLSAEGVFAGPPLIMGGGVELSKMGEAEQADIRKWAPELIVKIEGKEYFLTSQLYTVRR